MSPLRLNVISVAIAAVAIILAPRPAPASAQQVPLKTWSKLIPTAAQRFKVLSGFNNQAVLDKETGLVWEKAPASVALSWAYAAPECFQRTSGGRMGWRLPAIEELTSLLDATSSPPVLPAGHPFQVEDDDYWSATSSVFPEDIPLPGGLALVLATPLTHGMADFLNKLSTTKANVWCVRGGKGYDAGPSGSVQY